MSVHGNILIVDDEAVLRQTLARILQRAGLHVTTAGTGQEALEYLAGQSFDLIYLDIRMPGLNGLQLLKLIHEQHAELPVVLFTAQPDLSSAMEAVRGGAVDYLLKPLEPRKLLERTQDILAQREKQRRKRELQGRIETLQSQLKSLDGAPSYGHESDAVGADPDRYLSCGKITLDLHTRRVSLDDQVIDLAPTAFDYLVVLARHAPHVVDYRTLVTEAQGFEVEGREAQELVKWHVHHIRQAIEADTGRPSRIINVRGSGYRLVAD